MIMNLVVAAMVLGMGYLWLTRGFFNSFLHLLCVIVAGALAFALWEPASYALLGLLPTGGFFGFAHGMAWGIGLIVPFAVSLVVLRVIVDKTVGANLNLANAVDYAGGAICGLCTGLIVTGIFIIGIGNTRLADNFFGYQPLWYNADRQAGAGSLKEADTLWIPADKLTAALYSGLSERAFSSPEPLSKWYPDLHTVGFASRISPQSGSGRNTLDPGDFRLTERYTVGDPRTGAPATEMLADIRDPTAQRYADSNGDPVGTGWIAGFVINFDAGAKEAGGRGAGPVVMSNGQVRLVVRSDSGETMNVYPVAAISQASAGDAVYGRWRYDSDGVHIASVGGASSVSMAFEFFLRPGDEPLGLYVKNVRVDLTDPGPAPRAYGTVSDRDSTILDGGLLKGAAGTDGAPTLDRSDEVIATRAASGAPSGFVQSESLGRPVSTQNIRRFFRLGDGNLVSDGEGQYDLKDVSRDKAPQERSLRVDSFGVASDQQMVQIDVSVGQDGSLLGPVARLEAANKPIRLVDTNGETYDAAGFLYEDRGIWKVRYTPLAPLKGSSDTPPLSTSRDDQKLVLLFIASLGVDIEYLTIGDKVIVTYAPPVKMEGQ